MLLKGEKKLWREYSTRQNKCVPGQVEQESTCFSRTQLLLTAAHAGSECLYVHKDISLLL